MKKKLFAFLFLCLAALILPACSTPKAECIHEYKNACDEICIKCSKIRPATHIEVPYEIPPTCSAVGRTGGTRCSVCELILIPPGTPVLPTMECVYEEYDYLTGAVKCIHCHSEYWNNDVVCNHYDKTLTKTASGHRVSICRDCGEEGIQMPTCPESHTLTVEIAPTYYNVGIKSVFCSACGYGKIEPIPPTNTGFYACEMTLQEYADAATQQLMTMAADTYTDCIADDAVDWYIYPFSRLDTYEQIKDFTLALVKNEKSDYDKAKKIYNWVCENIRYDLGVAEYTVDQTWETREAVCSQYVQLAHEMLSSVGIMSSYVSGYSTSGPAERWEQHTAVKLPTIFQRAYDAGHAVVACYIDGRVVIMDPTWGNSLNAEKYFDMSQEFLADYFIPLDMNSIKIIPPNVDVRNYGDALINVGDHTISLVYGELLESAGRDIGYNGLGFTFHLAYDACKETYLPQRKPQYIGSAYKSCLYYADRFVKNVCLPDGRAIDYTNFFLYTNLEKEKYGKEIYLPFDEFYMLYDDCLYQRFGDAYVLLSCLSDREELTVPSKINGTPVVRINSEFAQSSRVKRLIVSEGFTTVESNALGIKTLEALYLPSTLLSCSFAIDAPNLKIVQIHEGNKIFKTVDNVVYSKDGSTLLFYPCAKTDKEYTVVAETKAIRYIRYNPHLEKLHLPEGLELLGELYELPKLSFVNLPSSITRIDYIYGTALTEIVLPPNVTVLTGNALIGNSVVKRIVLPAKLAGMAPDIFWENPMLEEIVIAESNTHFMTVDGVLYTKDGKTLLVYPQNKADKTYTVLDGTVHIADFAFALNKNIREVILPASVKTLGMDAFYTTKIERIDLRNVEEIGGGCFADCDNLRMLVLPQSVKKVAEQLCFDSGVEYLIIENPALEVTATTFLRAEKLKIFLCYDTVTDKERYWIPSVAGVYAQSEWTYINGVPTPLQ